MTDDLADERNAVRHHGPVSVMAPERCPAFARLGGYRSGPLDASLTQRHPSRLLPTRSDVVAQGLRKIKDVLRLHLVGGVASRRQLARAVGCGPSCQIPELLRVKGEVLISSDPETHSRQSVPYSCHDPR
jgi:hypothetical protein